MFCDRCDRGFHTYCVGVKEVPSGSWFCLTCKTSDGSDKSTPIKSKLNSSIHNSTSQLSNSPNTTPAKRGRPAGSLNKPKLPQQMVKDINTKYMIKDLNDSRNSKMLLKDLIESKNSDYDSSEALSISVKKR